MSKLHRAQILLEDEQHRRLSEIARQKESSVSELVRSAVNQFLAEHQAESIRISRLKALEVIARHKDEILERRDGRPLAIDVEAVIKQIREEGDDQLFDAAFRHGS